MNTINRKTVSYLLTILTVLALVSTAIAAVSLYHEMPMNVTIEGESSMSLYVDDAAWSNGTSIGWGTLSPGSITEKNLSILNTGSIALQVTFTVSGLPSGWDMTYSKNGTIVQPGAWLNGTVALVTSSLSADAQYYWVTGIHAS